MEWFKVISQVIVSLIWPGIVLTLVLLFRKEIRGMLSAIKEVKYPGGSITVEVAKLEERVEKSVTLSKEAVETKLLTEPSVIRQADPQLAIAQIRTDAEKELFRLSWRTLNQKEIKEWDVARHIDELQRAEILEPEFAGSLREFVRLSNSIIHGSEVTDEVKSRLSGVGTSLVAQLHYRRKVFDMVRDFDGHGLWHMHKHLEDDTRKYYFWSAVAASLPEFDYNYDIYREAAERHNRKIEEREGSNRPSKHSVYVLPLDEFIQVLEYREQVLLRLIEVWRKPQGNTTEELEQANRWRWPAEWGDLGWSGSILRERLSLYSAEDDLMQTRMALNRYRMRLLTHSRPAALERARPSSD
jgi:hypothetical protein